jgi:F0F1-type ATP synthase assembly protein I
MVVLELRLRQNREANDEDLRANKKTFERQQQQVAIMPQSEKPPNDKLQAITYQFNKDVENVKNALNDGLTDMNTPDTINRGFADFSKVSLSWNKLVARINPYLKGQQTGADIQPATAGDYAYVRQKLKDDLAQFFANAIQQINAFKRAVGLGVRVQNEEVVADILQQLNTGFYKNVKYGAESRSSLYVPRLPPNPNQGAMGPAIGPQGPPPQGPQGPPQQPPQQPAPQPAPQQQGNAANLQQGDINQFDAYVVQMGRDPQNFPDIFDPANAQQVATIIEALALQQHVALGNQQPDAQARAAFIANVIRKIPDYEDYVQQQLAANAPQPQQGQQGGPAQPQPRNPQQVVVPGIGPDRGRPPNQNAMAAIADTATRLGVADVLSGYAGMTKAQKGTIAWAVQQVADEITRTTGNPTSYKSIQRYLNLMVGFGRGEMRGDGVQRGVRGRPLRMANNFDGLSEYPNTLADFKNRYRLGPHGDYVGPSTGAIIPRLQNRGVLGSGNNTLGYDDSKLTMMRTRGGRSEGGVLQIGDDSLVAADAQSRDWQLLGDEDREETDPFANPSIPARVADLARRKGREILQQAINAFIAAATNSVPVVQAAAQAIGGGAMAALPQVLAALQELQRLTVVAAQATGTAAQATAQAARTAYQATATKIVLQFLSDYPEMLIPFVAPLVGMAVGGIGSAVGIMTVGLARTYLRRNPDGSFGSTGRGSGRCCFNSGMCNGTKAYRFKRGSKSANVRKESVKGGMMGSGNGVEVNVKYSKLPKALQPSYEDLHPTPTPRGGQRVGLAYRRPRMPKESYEGYHDEENDVYTHSGRMPPESEMLHSEMLQDKALGLLKGMPRRIGVEDPKFKPSASNRFGK